MNAAFRARSGAQAQAPVIVSRETTMLRRQRLTRKSAARTTAYRAGPDMALATTIVFFGVFPAVMAAGLAVVQIVGALAH
jgi:hypothetical protein